MGSTEVWLRGIIEAALSGQPLSIDIAPVTAAIGTTNSEITQLNANQNTSLSTLATLVGITNADLAALILANHADLTAIVNSLTALTAAVNNISPIKKSGTAVLKEILSVDIPANTPKKLMDANPNRLGFCVYNNSTNSLYVGPANSPAGGRLFAQPATNAGPTALQTFFGPMIWTGEVWVIRNSGTGGVVGYEFLP